MQRIVEGLARFGQHRSIINVQKRTRIRNVMTNISACNCHDHRHGHRRHRLEVSLRHWRLGSCHTSAISHATPIHVPIKPPPYEERQLFEKDSYKGASRSYQKPWRNPKQQRMDMPLHGISSPWTTVGIAHLDLGNPLDQLLEKELRNPSCALVELMTKFCKPLEQWIWAAHLQAPPLCQEVFNKQLETMNTQPQAQSTPPLSHQSEVYKSNPKLSTTSCT